MKDIKGTEVVYGCRVVVVGADHLDSIVGQIGYVHKMLPSRENKNKLHALVYDVPAPVPPVDEPPEDMTWGAWCEEKEISVIGDAALASGGGKSNG